MGVKLAQACKVMGFQHSMTSRVIIAADAVHDVERVDVPFQDSACVDRLSAGACGAMVV
jgi:hypothetical protein